MKRIIAISLFFIFFNNFSYSQPAWFEQQTGYSINQTVECVHFFNAQTGIIGGGFGVFARTTNGGANWIHINNNVNNHYHSITFINSNTGWISGAFYNSSYVMEMIRKTTDGGLTWDSAYFDADARAWDIQFLNGTTGYMAGKYIKKTTNGGINWFVINNNENPCMNYSVFFLNTLTGWASKYYSDQYLSLVYTKLIKTTDGGLNWITQIYDSSSSNNSIMDIQFLNENTGYIVNVTFGVFKTTNSGQNWYNINTNSSNYKLYFINENTGWIGSWNYIRKTTNGGTNWMSQFLYQGCFFRGMYFLNEFTGWTSGMTNNTQPKLYKTTIGGVSAIKQIFEVVPSSFSLSQNYPNPFNPVTKIKFDVASSLLVPIQREIAVSVIVYDVMGREVQTLVNESLQPGTYETTFDGSMLNSGVYFYRLTAGDFSETKKMLLIK